MERTSSKCGGSFDDVFFAPSSGLDASGPSIGLHWLQSGGLL